MLKEFLWSRNTAGRLGALGTLVVFGWVTQLVAQETHTEEVESSVATVEQSSGPTESDPLAPVRAALRVGAGQLALERLRAVAPEVRRGAEGVVLEVEALLKDGRVDEAWATASAASDRLASASTVLTVQAKTALRMGDFNAAGQLYYAAAQKSPADPQAHLGLAKLFEAERRMISAQREVRNALAVARGSVEFPEVALRILPRAELAQAFDLSSPWQSPYGLGPPSLTAWLDAQDGCRLSSPRQRYEIELRQFRPRPDWQNRFGVPLVIDGVEVERTLLDTGAPGLTITRSLAEAAGAKKLWDGMMSGVGDEGPRRGYYAQLARVEVGEAVFTDCPAFVLEDEFRYPGAAPAILGIDGLWEDFLVTIDVPQLRLVLDPQAVRPRLPNGEPNRWSVERDLANLPPGWAPVRLFGHRVMLPALLDEKVEAYFLLDTGAWATVISQRVAEQLGNDLRSSNIQIVGISGAAEDVLEVHGQTQLMFPGVAQKHRNLKILPFDRHDISYGGVIGYSLLQYTEITIDGRRALVKLEPGKVRKRPKKIR